jgi:hypothetical protein
VVDHHTGEETFMLSEAEKRRRGQLARQKNFAAEMAALKKKEAEELEKLQAKGVPRGMAEMMLKVSRGERL